MPGSFFSSWSLFNKDTFTKTNNTYLFDPKPVRIPLLEEELLNLRCGNKKTRVVLKKNHAHQQTWLWTWLDYALLVRYSLNIIGTLHITVVLVKGGTSDRRSSLCLEVFGTTAGWDPVLQPGFFEPGELPILQLHLGIWKELRNYSVPPGRGSGVEDRVFHNIVRGSSSGLIRYQTYS